MMKTLFVALGAVAALAVATAALWVREHLPEES